MEGDRLNNIAGTPRWEEDHENTVEATRGEARRYPPGYRFSPQDHELINDYLVKKVANLPLPRDNVKEVNLYDYSPDYLLEEFKNERDEKELYFFTPRIKKYANGSRPNRTAGDGYWKATGGDKKIYHEKKVIGYKKSLVFCVGRPPCGTKKDWIMHEYRLDKKLPKANKEKNRLKSKEHVDMKLDNWVLCRIKKKTKKKKKNNASSDRDAEPSLPPALQAREESEVGEGSSTRQVNDCGKEAPSLQPALQGGEESVLGKGSSTLQPNDCYPLPLNLQPMLTSNEILPSMHIKDTQNCHGFPQTLLPDDPIHSSNIRQYCNGFPQTSSLDDLVDWTDFSGDFKFPPLEPAYSMQFAKFPSQPDDHNRILTEERMQFNPRELCYMPSPISYDPSQCTSNMISRRSPRMNMVDVSGYDQKDDDFNPCAICYSPAQISYNPSQCTMNMNNVRSPRLNTVDNFSRYDHKENDFLRHDQKDDDFNPCEICYLPASISYNPSQCTMNMNSVRPPTMNVVDDFSRYDQKAADDFLRHDQNDNDLSSHSNANEK